MRSIVLGVALTLIATSASAQNFWGPFAGSLAGSYIGTTLALPRQPYQGPNQYAYNRAPPPGYSYNSGQRSMDMPVGAVPAGNEYLDRSTGRLCRDFVLQGRDPEGYSHRGTKTYCQVNGRLVELRTDYHKIPLGTPTRRGVNAPVELH